MPDAADRIRVETRSAPRAKAFKARSFAPPTRRIVAGAALAAMMIGIVVNALALQHGRRINLGVDDAATAAATAAAPVAARPAAVLPTPAPAAAIPTPPRPAPTTVALARPEKSGDAIADFLRTQGSDKRKTTLAAQSALADLGFSVKATGALDAPTRSALVAFEKTRHLAVSTEVTPKLLHALKDAAAAN